MNENYQSIEKKNENKERIFPEAYTLLTSEIIEEVGGEAFVFEHKVTGARVLYISNDDDNKVFSIGFKTPSDNSTGVAHIMEHSVLCGSDKYPVKEPFVELAKGSLNTFLNAMTYPDKTVYPIASTNDKDFMNLMDVYLDAVFHPAIYHNPEIFMQEGWHYHIEDPDDPITFNGVVYSEMKGVYSSPEEVLNNALMQALYPDTIYGGESGGHPDHIPDLTYEDFLNFHRSYYHPSNSYIYLYGNGDMEKHLSYMDSEYLSHYSRQSVTSDIPMQPVFEEPVKAEAVYPISAGEDTKEKDYLTLGWMVKGEDYESTLMMDILGHILLENNSAPLKKALLDLNICKEVDYVFSTSMQQPFAAVVLKNTSGSHAELFETTVLHVLEELAEQGLNPLDVAAGINTAEFNIREAEYGTYPKGLVIGLELFDTWLYDDSTSPFRAFDHLQYDRIFRSIRERAAHGGFEKMIRDYFLENTHRALVVMTPDAALQEKQDAVLKEKLAAYKEGLSPETINELVEATKSLLAHQAQEDSPEALATIPKLSLDEIDPEPRDFSYVEERFEDLPLLWHPIHTGGIVYVKFFFDIHGVAEKDLPYLSLLNKFLCEVATEDHDLAELVREIEIYTGGITGNITLYSHSKEVDRYAALLAVKGKALAQHVPKLMALMESVTLHPLFNDEKLMHDLIGEIRLDKEDHFLTAGHSAAVHRLQSYYSAPSKLAEIMDGIDFYRFIVDLDTHFEERASLIKEKLNGICKQVFTRNSLVLSLTCDESDKADALESIGSYLKALPAVPEHLYEYVPELKVRNEGFKTAAQIQYVAQGYNFRRLGHEYTGTLPVLKSFLYTGYLWTRVRVQGGAYGGMFGINRAGELFFTSYRDPNLSRTFSVYEETAEYLTHLEISDRELEKVIIGTISSKDMPLTPSMFSAASDQLYFNGTTMEDIAGERWEILHVSREDLRKTAALVADCLQQNCRCVIGGDETVEANREYFNETAYLLGESE